jgi:hypothetical protein
MIFADAPIPNANTTWLVINSLMAFAAAFATVGLYFNSRKRQETAVYPQPLVIALEKEFVHQKQFDAYKADQAESRRRLYERHEELREELHEMENRINAQGEERTVKVHERVNEILLAVGELRGEVRNLK